MKRNPKEAIEGTRRLTRRALLLGGAQAAVVAVLIGRMRHLQVEQADQFRLLAEENRINIRLLPPTRGQIFDRNGVAIAENVPSYRITMVREDAGDVDLVLRRLSALITLEPAELERARNDLRRLRGDTPVTVADRVSWEDISKVAVNGPALPGVTPEVGLSRHYPMAGDFAHVVGQVGPVSDFDLSRIENPDPLLRLPRYLIGKAGVEGEAEDLLRGSAGVKRVEVNAVGRVMRELDRREGKAGANVQLTVDHRLQNYVQTRLQGQSAAAIVMDVDSGDLLAIASAPSYDPNLFVRGISVAQYAELTENPYRPLLPKCVQGLYPPGSTFKMVTALAALEAGVITPEDRVFCPGHLEVSGRRFHCWKRAGHGSVNLNASLAESCDVYYYDIAIKTGIERIAEMARRLGLGTRFDLPMPSVRGGIVPSREYKQQRFGTDWVVGDTVNASIGQGFVLTSPLQLAVMTARLATGRSVRPRLLKSVDGVEQPSGHGEEMGLDPVHLRHIRRGMDSTVNGRTGTAFGSRIVAEGMRMSGKTGTSQVRNITAAERARGVIRNEDLPWERRDHALFVNYAPIEAPRIAVSVVVEHGGGGSSTAAPIARDITLQALYGDDPPLTAYPERDRSRIRAQQERYQRERLSREQEEAGSRA